MSEITRYYRRRIREGTETLMDAVLGNRERTLAKIFLPIKVYMHAQDPDHVMLHHSLTAVIEEYAPKAIGDLVSIGLLTGASYGLYKALEQIL